MVATDDRLKTLGMSIATQREKQGISQIELSRMLGYTNHAYLSRIENGKTAPSMALLFAIADALDLKVSYFFTEL